MGKHTTSKMCPLASKTCSPRLLPSRPQRVFGIQLRLLGFPTLPIPILSIMRGIMSHSLLIMVISRIILILGRDIRRIVHNLTLVPRHLHVVVATANLFSSPGRLRLKSHPVSLFLSLCLNQKHAQERRTSQRKGNPSTSLAPSRAVPVVRASFPSRAVLCRGSRPLR